ncbi:MAG: YggS family pyridoxal phosphate-dependent enzyme [Desulfovibrio sp.]|jgi:pyridoxal phosphate enzyme (YggS family)|nr:YggS family pyridoxal phosphate-dependent enzyme [Desulfovibrio sp.]
MDERELQDRFEAVRARIAGAARRSGRDGRDVRLVAASKGQDAATIIRLAGYWAGRGDRPAFGENYIQESVAKRAEVERLAPGLDLEWHFLGRLQTNKARDAAGQFRLIHSLDSLRQGLALQKAGAGGSPEAPAQPVLIQINLGREAQKSGIPPEDAESLARDLTRMTRLDVQGLMCLPPEREEAESVRPFFRSLRELRDALRPILGRPLPHLSMGMSHDFEIAVEEGATLVRVGTEIFGPRR